MENGCKKDDSVEEKKNKKHERVRRGKTDLGNMEIGKIKKTRKPG